MCVHVCGHLEWASVRVKSEDSRFVNMLLCNNSTQSVFDYS